MTKNFRCTNVNEWGYGWGNRTAMETWHSYKYCAAGVCLIISYDHMINSDSVLLMADGSELQHNIRYYTSAAFTYRLRLIIQLVWVSKIHNIQQTYAGKDSGELLNYYENKVA
jgi:hypothetical protein